MMRVDALAKRCMGKGTPGRLRGGKIGRQDTCNLKNTEATLLSRAAMLTPCKHTLKTINIQNCRLKYGKVLSS